MLAYKKEMDERYKVALAATSQREELQDALNLRTALRRDYEWGPAEYREFRQEEAAECKAWNAYYKALALYRARTGRVD
jgi:hypothetical protein